MKKKVAKRRSSKPAHQKKSAQEPVISFESLEFPHHSKNELWYIGIGLLLLVGLFLALNSANYLLAAVVIAAGLAIFRIARERPESKKVEINPRGIRWGDRFFGFHQLKAFWASEEKGQLTVYLEQPNFAPVIHFLVPTEKAIDTLTVLSLELPFHYHKDEPLSDRFNRLLRI